MEIGVFLASTGNENAEDIAAILQHIEAAGINSIWVPEHVVLFDKYESEYPYSKNGKLPMPASIGIADPLIFLSFAAGVTKTLRCR